MDKLRKPFLVAAIVLMVVVIVVELGGTLAFGLLDRDTPPGLGIPYLALLDGLLLFTLILIGAGAVVPERTIARVQGCITCVVAVLVILIGIPLIFVAFSLLMLMIGLIMSFFGAIIYLAVWGDFPRGAAAAILGLLLMLKVAVGICLVLAHQRFLQNIGLVVIVIFSLVLNIVVAFIHDFPPGILVSIADAIAAIIVGIVAVIIAVVFAIFAIVSIVMAIRPPSVGGGDKSPTPAPGR